MEPVIVARDLAKRYSLGAQGRTSLRETIQRWGCQMTGRIQRPENRYHWALRDVSFSITPGETVGIVGNNGAGKSTLLKILSRITPPTRGTVTFRGRVGSLLEVGTGFHPELSGRDNVFLNGIILGMSRRDIARRFDEIVAFAEVERFIDTPVKRYSSGMYLRLAFAVAAHLDADILLVDEVLAVGDIAFQKKCLTRMKEVAADGRAILFVSHNLIAVQALCSRSLWVDGGALVENGPTPAVLSRYLRKSAGCSDTPGHRVWSAGSGPSGGNVELLEARIRRAAGQLGDPIDVDTAFMLELLLRVARSDLTINTSLSLINDQDITVFNTGPAEEPAPWAAGVHHVRCDVPAHLLNDGLYRIAFEVIEGGETTLAIPELLVLDVLDSNTDRHGWYGKWEGIVRPRLAWSRERVPAAPYRLP